MYCIACIAEDAAVKGVLLQELVDKAPKLPNDTRWHFVGHLQSNKAKMLVGEIQTS